MVRPRRCPPLPITLAEWPRAVPVLPVEGVMLVPVLPCAGRSDLAQYQPGAAAQHREHGEHRRDQHNRALPAACQALAKRAPGAP